MSSADIPDSWTLKIILQTLSKAIEVPLRAVRLDPLARPCGASAKTPGVSGLPLFDKPATGEDCSEEDWLESAYHYSRNGAIWENTYNAFSNTLSLTDSYNAYPLVMAFREHKVWRRLSLCNILGHLHLLSRLADTGPLNVTFFSHFQLSLAKTSLPNVAIIAGPVWMPLEQERPSGQLFYERRELPAIHLFNTIILRAGGEPIYNDHRLRRLAASRWPVARNDLADRLRIAAMTTESVCEAVSSTTCIRRQCDLIGLTEWAVYVVRETFSQGSELLRAALQRNLSNAVFRIAHSASPPDIPASVLVRTAWTQTSIGGLARPRFDVMAAEVPKSYGAEPESSKPAAAYHAMRESEDSTASPNSGFARFESLLRVQDNAYKMESLFLIREWLTEQIGVLRALSSVVEDADDRLARVSDKMARRTAQLLNADVGTIYQYAHKHAMLETVGLYAPWQPSWNRIVPSLMERANGLTERPFSISYRALDTRETRFCRSFDPGSGKADPEGESLLALPGQLESARSGIASPITIFSRPWGVLEVVGARAFQFRWYDKCLLDEISTLLSPFYYNFHFLTHFHGLNVDAVGAAPFKRRYGAICNRVAGLFLCESAVLWLRESALSNSFRLTGWHNRPDLDRLYGPGETVGPLLSDDDPLAITLTLVRRGEAWWQGALNAPPLDAKWLSKPYTNGLTALGIRHVAFIPIENKRGDCIASVSLFSSAAGGWSQEWEPLIKFTKRYLEVLLSAMHSRQQWEQHAVALIAHALEGGVHDLSTAAANIADIAETARPPSDNYRRKLRNWRSDLYSADQECKVAMRVLTSGGLAEMDPRAADPELQLLRKTIEEVPAVDNDMEQFFNSVFRPDIKSRVEKGLLFEHEQQAHRLFVKMHRTALRMVLNVLYTNALKYAPPNTAVRARIRERPRSFDYAVENLGFPLADGEDWRIFQRGFRGINAEGKEGHGLGLYTARYVCDRYGIIFDYRSHSSEAVISPYPVWHVFYMDIPKTLCRLT